MGECRHHRPGQPSLTRALALAALALLAMPAGAQQLVLSDFQWTLGGDPGGSGWVQGDRMHLVSSDDGLCSGGGLTTFTAPAPSSPGVVSFVAVFDNQDTGFSPWHFEHPVYVIDGAKFAIGDPHSSFSGSYEVSFAIEPGQVFGVGVQSVDCSSGPGVLDVKDFRFEQAPGTWVDLGGALQSPVAFTAVEHVPGPANASGDDLVVSACGDANADGVADLAEGRPASGLVRIVSGADGSILHEWTRPGRFGAALAPAGDVDLDGHDDLLVGAPFDTSGGPSAGRAYVLSGADGSEIHVVTGFAFDELGACVLGGLDFDDDPYPDFAVGLPGTPPFPGRVGRYRGVDGSQLTNFLQPPGSDPGTGFPHRIANLGKSGSSQRLAVSDPLYDGGRGRVHVYSLGTSSPQVSLEGSAPGVGFGEALVGLGDTDGDGQHQFAVGVPREVVGGQVVGSVVVHELPATTLAVLLRLDGSEAGEEFGAALASGGDVDFDGRPDLAIGAPGALGGAGRTLVVNVAFGTVHADVVGPAGERSGSSVALLGDVDGNGASAVATARPLGSAGAGAVDVLHDVQGSAGPPELTAEGPQFAGERTTLRLAHAPPAAPVWLVVGLQALSAPLLGGTLVPSPDVLLPVQADAGGELELDFGWPHILPPSVELYWQAWVVDPLGPQGFSASNALRSSAPGLLSTDG